MSKKSVVLILVLYLFGLFLHLGRMYFQHEEPRRAIIALEMNCRHNYIEPTVLGRLYFKKPPLHNAVIALFFKIFGANEFAARLVSVLSLILFGAAVFVFAHKALDFDSSFVAAFSFLSAFVTYFSYGALAETDMFFSLLVFLSMISLYMFESFGIIVGGVFAALALMTKGFPALHYYYLSLIAFAVIEKKIKEFSFYRDSVIASIIIFGTFAIWMVAISHGDVHRFHYALGFLLQESGGRVLSVEHLLRVVKHAFLFPVRFWLHFLPFAVLSLFLAKKGFREDFYRFITSNEPVKRILKFSLVVFLPNFAIYDIIPDGRIRYTLPLFGFFALFLGVVFYKLKSAESKPTPKFRRLFEAVFALLFVLSLFGALFVFNFTRTHDYYICVFSAFICLFLGKYLLDDKLFAYKRLIVGLAGVAIVLKFLYVSVYGSYLYTYYTNYRLYGKKIARILLKNHPEYVMSDGRNLRLFFYVERDLGLCIHPIRNRSGWVVSEHKEKVGDVRYKVDTPKGVYYLGFKKGG